MYLLYHNFKDNFSFVINKEIDNMKVKTTQSFFPTDAKLPSKTPNCEKYIVIKKANHLLKNSSDHLQQNSINIFKNASVDGIYQFNYKEEKPVGGLANFVKYQKIKKKKNRSFKLSAEEMKKSLYQSKLTEKKFEETSQNVIQSPVKAPPEETFKKHESYSTTLYKKNSNEKRNRPLTTQNGTKTKSIEWAKNQSISYHNKMAYLNEIYYKKPLNQRYGDKNRYEDDLPPPAYIYQIDDSTHKEIDKNQFISKLRKNHPGLKNRQKLVIKGTAQKFL